MRSIYYYGTTTICAVILGITLVLIIRPGVVKDTSAFVAQNYVPARNVTTTDTLLDLLR